MICGVQNYVRLHFTVIVYLYNKHFTLAELNCIVTLFTHNTSTEYIIKYRQH